MLNIRWFEDLILVSIDSRRLACDVDPCKDLIDPWCRDFAHKRSGRQIDAFNFTPQKLLHGEVLSAPYDVIARGQIAGESSLTTAAVAESAPGVRKTR